jgi:uncharacterized integral membrane protein (TIGR00698 family)
VRKVPIKFLQGEAIWLLLFFGISVLIVSLHLSAQISLALGITTTLLIKNPFKKQSSNLSKILIQSSIILMGFGMNIKSILLLSIDTFFSTLYTIVLTLLLGYYLGKIFKVPQTISSLISVGTAICGGSAIIAISSVLIASETEISIAIACVFIFNGLALFLIPYLGNLLELSQINFGKWAGICIHDISSVVGAASKFGQESLEVATAVKLSRTLWIIPLCVAYLIVLNVSKSKQNNLLNKEKNKSSFKIPIFIIFYLLTSAYSSSGYWIPIKVENIQLVAKTGFTLALFLIGLNTSFENIKKAGIHSLSLAGTLWITIAILSLFFVIRIW